MTQFILSKSYGYVVPRDSCLSMCCMEGVRSSANCSAPTSVNMRPLYQILPPVSKRPLLISTIVLSASLFWLYPGISCEGIWMNRKSSTHFTMGPIPFTCSRSARASPNRPKSPPAVAQPKLLLVLRANVSVSLDMRTTTPGHWFLCRGIILYASAMSQVAAWAPGGRFRINVHVVLNVPQVQGKSSDLSCALIDGVGRFMCGCDRFCIN